MNLHSSHVTIFWRDSFRPFLTSLSGKWLVQLMHRFPQFTCSCIFPKSITHACPMFYSRVRVHINLF